MKAVLLLLAVSLLTGCSTHMTKIQYQGIGAPSSVAGKAVAEVVVLDQRGTDGDWLGAVRGGYGNRLKTLRTDKPTDQVVGDAYRAALETSNLYGGHEHGVFQLRVTITKFDCSYYFNREAHAHLLVSLIEKGTAKEVFSQTYRADEVESGVGAGIFGDVDTLRQLAERTLNKAIDKNLQDAAFITALTTATTASRHGNIEERLRELKSLFDQGLIEKSEYDAKRVAVMDQL